MSSEGRARADRHVRATHAYDLPAAEPSRRFDDWLTETVALPESERSARLERWAQGPDARECHPREEHLLPLMVAAGAAGADGGSRVFRDEVMGATVSAVRFG